MLFSSILTSYHRIGLDSLERMAIDSHFTAMAHHSFRWREAIDGSNEESFHQQFAKLHATALLTIVWERGRFEGAIDPTGEDRHLRSWWDPAWGEIPDEDIAAMYPDWRYPVGFHHPHDILVTSYSLARKAG